MPYDENGLEIISATARIDEEEFLHKCAKDLARCEPTRPAPPAGVSCLELERSARRPLRSSSARPAAISSCAPLLKRIEQLEQGEGREARRRLQERATLRREHACELPGRAVDLESANRNAARERQPELGDCVEEG